MFSKLFFILASLACAIALSVKDVGIGEFKLETFETQEEPTFKAGNHIAITPKVVWPVNFFNAVNGQQLIGQARNHALPTGTSRIRLTYNSGFPGPGRISQVLVYVDIPAINAVSSALVYTQQFERSFQGDIILNSTTTQVGSIGWYAYAIE